jgi:hypothetical protein
VGPAKHVDIGKRRAKGNVSGRCGRHDAAPQRRIPLTGRRRNE